MARDGASNTGPVTRGGVGFFGLLALLFIALKLTGHIDWGWEWVLLPLYGPFAVGLAIAAVLIVVAALLYVVASIAEMVLSTKAETK